MAILLIEDDPAVQDLVTTLLSTAGFAVDVASDGATGHRLCASQKYEVIILDLGLPDLDGVEVCRRLRSARPGALIVILTARADKIDVVVGLDAGADDYLVNPVALVELHARLRAHLRRPPRPRRPARRSCSGTSSSTWRAGA